VAFLTVSTRDLARKSLSQQDAIIEKLDVDQKTNLKNYGVGAEVLTFISSKVNTVKKIEDVAGRLQSDLISTLEGAELKSQVLGDTTMIITEQKRRQFEELLLSPLRYEGMADRSNRISEAHSATFHWVFEYAHTVERRWSNLIPWLMSEDQCY